VGSRFFTASDKQFVVNICIHPFRSPPGTSVSSSKVHNHGVILYKCATLLQVLKRFLPMLLKKPSGVSGNTSPAPTSVVSSESSAPANVLPTVRPEANELNNTFTNLRDNLKIFAFIRGGRLPSSVKSRLPNSPQSPGRNTPLFISKLLHLVKLFPRLFLFAVPDVQYAKASSLRSSDLSTLQDSDITTLMESFRNTCFEELKLIVAVASFLSA
jgi:hypothetical protein